MIARIIKRTKEDSGNEVVILGIMLLMVLMLVGGLLLDISKAYQLKSSYVDAAKKATQAAIMEQDSRGYLKADAAAEAVRVYEKIIRPSIVNPKGYFSKCEDYGDDDVVLRAVFYKGDVSGGKEFTYEIKRSQVNTVSDKDEAEIQRKNIAELMGLNIPTVREEISKKNFDSIQLEVLEGTENTILPGAFALTQGDEESQANIKCQQMKIVGKANIFVGDEESKYN